MRIDKFVSEIALKRYQREMVSFFSIYDGDVKGFGLKKISYGKSDLIEKIASFQAID